MSDSPPEIKPKSKRGGYRPGAGRKPKIHPPVEIDLAAVTVAAQAAAQKRQPQPVEPEDPPVIIKGEPQDEAADEAREFLRAVMREQGLDPKLRIDAAKALLRGAPAAAVGKKDQRQADALTAHEGTGWDDLLPPVAAGSVQ